MGWIAPPPAEIGLNSMCCKSLQDIDLAYFVIFRASWL